MRLKNALKNRTSTVLSVLFAVFSLIGWVYCTYPVDDFYFKSPFKYMILLGVLTGFLVLHKLIFTLVLSVYDHIKKSRPCSLFEGNVFVKILIVSAVVYGLWWFVFFPGTLHPDMTHHLYQGLGIQPLSKIVPVFLTKLVGTIMTVSKVVFLNDNVGVAIYVCGLYVAQCLTVSYMFLLFKKLGTPTIIRWFAFIYVFFIPVLSIWVVDFGKDTPYYFFMLLFMCSMVDLIITDKPGIGKYLLIAVSILGVAWSRNNGLVMLVPSIVVYALVIRKDLRRFIPVCLVCMLVLFGADKFFASRYEIGEAPVRENLSLPVQTYVSYLREYGNELSDEEAADVSMLFSASVEELVESYDPEVSDPVKNRFVYSPTDEQMDTFWCLWKSGFKAHPGTYIRGFLRHSYGYFYPGKDCFRNRTAIYTLDFHTEYYSFEYSWKDSPIREAFIAFCEGIYKFPVTNMLYRPGFQMLALISLVAVILTSRNKRYICVLIPNLMMLFVVLSPVSAYFRYMLPVFAALPLSIAWAIYSKDVNGKEDIKTDK